MSRISVLYTLLLSACWCISYGQPSAPMVNSGSLTIRFDNLESDKGYIRLALYSGEDSFMDEEHAILYSYRIDRPGSMEGILENLPYGEYAFAVFHDENNNDELDTNFLGIPVEPFCFSRPAPSKWRVPTFDEAKIMINRDKQDLVVRLQRWKL